VAKKAWQEHARLYDFRDADIMFRLNEVQSDKLGLSTPDVADLLGFEPGDNRGVGIRLSWMQRYGMVAYDREQRLWSLSESGRRVIAAQIKAPTLKVIENIPDESMVEVMALVTSRYHRGDHVLAHLLRREFMFGTKKS
jgi:hypothetical protein